MRFWDETGAFARDPNGDIDWNTTGTSRMQDQSALFNASYSNSIYTDSGYVRPKSLTLNYLIKI